MINHDNQKNKDNNYGINGNFYKDFESGVDNEDVNNELEELDKKRKSSLRLIGIITLIFFISAFLSFIIKHYNLPSLDFLLKSSELSDDPKIRNMQKAVVEIRTHDKKGTGFNIDHQGTIITNYHVVEGKSSVNINFSNGKVFTESSRLNFPEIDISIININGADLPYLTPDFYATLSIGDVVTIIGNPLGIPRIVTKGEIVGTTVLKNWKKPVLMIKGTIHHGSSGSPVINEEGNVFAVIFGTFDNNDTIIGAAVPIEYIKDNLP